MNGIFHQCKFKTLSFLSINKLQSVCSPQKIILAKPTESLGASSSLCSLRVFSFCICISVTFKCNSTFADSEWMLERFSIQRTMKEQDGNKILTFTNMCESPQEISMDNI